MRIIGGTLKGRKLNAPHLPDARPTTDFARESLFNILQSRYDLERIKVLDLFAGSGSIAFEFISRGAFQVTCVDLYAPGLAFIRNTAKDWEVNIETVKSDVFRFLKGKTTPYDIVFADPPFEHKGVTELPGLVIDNGWVKENGLFIAEHGKAGQFNGFGKFVEERTYGKVHFSFFKNE
ncbi:MAG: 16S rRNA (guanine(966)-N(2))-methyltransferase RsmD [Bacteroidota bacterium]